jgi:hypothetical protein
VSHALSLAARMLMSENPMLTKRSIACRLACVALFAIAPSIACGGRIIDGGSGVGAARGASGGAPSGGGDGMGSGATPGSGGGGTTGNVVDACQTACETNNSLRCSARCNCSLCSTAPPICRRFFDCLASVASCGEINRDCVPTEPSQCYDFLGTLCV